MTVLNITDQLALVDESPLDLHVLAENAQHAAAAFIAAGTAANTLRSYRSALAYWSAWLQLRYGQALGDAPLPAAVAVQFVLDHLARPLADGSWTHLLPSSIDAALVAARVKAKVGPLAFNTVSHRLSVLGKWHRIKAWNSPTEASALKTLLREARKAQSRQGVTVRKKTAIVLEPLQALLATCSDGVRGVRDRALLLLVGVVAVAGVPRWWACRWVMCVNWMPTLGSTPWARPRLTPGVCAAKSRYAARRQKHCRTGWPPPPPTVAHYFADCIYKGGKVGKVGIDGLSSDQVARIVQRRAQLAGLDGDWAAHSLRSGFITEAGRQGVPLGEVMAMTEHRSVSTVMGYFQSGALIDSRATQLLDISKSSDAHILSAEHNRHHGRRSKMTGVLLNWRLMPTPVNVTECARNS